MQMTIYRMVWTASAYVKLMVAASMALRQIWVVSAIRVPEIVARHKALQS